MTCLRARGIHGRYASNLNLFSIGRALAVSDVKRKTECVLEVESRNLPVVIGNQAIVNTCNIVYVQLPQFPTHSDAYKFERELPNLLPKDKQIIFVVEGASPDVKDLLIRLFPTARVMSL